MSLPVELSHPAQVGARFSAAAATYPGASMIQDRVAHHVMAITPASLEPGNVLDAGCGPGRLAALARQRWPSACIDGVDVAPDMIAAASALFADDAKARFRVGDMSTLGPELRYGLILSGSALHWLRPFGAGFGRVAALVRPGGLMVAGLMLDGTLAELRAARRIAAPSKPEGVRLPAWSELQQAVANAQGFEVTRMEQMTLSCEQPDAAAMLRQIHAMGVTGGVVSRRGPPLNRHELAALIHDYDRNYTGPGGVIATFIVGYVVMEKIAV